MTKNTSFMMVLSFLLGCDGDGEYSASSIGEAGSPPQQTMLTKLRDQRTPQSGKITDGVRQTSDHSPNTPQAIAADTIEDTSTRATAVPPNAFPLKNREALTEGFINAGVYAPQHAAASYSDDMFPILDSQDLARKEHILHNWQTVLTDGEQQMLREQAGKENNAQALTAGLAWHNCFWFLFPPPTAVLDVKGSRPNMKWRMYGGGIPFYLDGNTDSKGFVELYVGWGLSFISVDVLRYDGERVNCSFNAFPG